PWRRSRGRHARDPLGPTPTRHGAIAAKIATLFHVRFDPRVGPVEGDRAVGEAALAAEIDADLAQVESLDEDRIIRHFVNVVQAAVRTNFYQLGGGGRGRGQNTAKLHSRNGGGMPPPRPLFEIFRHSPPPARGAPPLG